MNLSPQAPLFRLLFLLCLSFPLAQAAEPLQLPVTPLDRQYMEQQHERIETLTQRHYGRNLSGTSAKDIPLMQRLLDDGIVRSNQRSLLQGMGIILGELLRREEALSWIIYEDRLGRSRALSIPNQRDVLFPTTIISVRVEAGTKVRIDEVYRELKKELERIRKQIVVF